MTFNHYYTPQVIVAQNKKFNIVYFLLKPHVGTESFYGSFETNMQKIVGNKWSTRSLLNVRYSIPMQPQL